MKSGTPGLLIVLAVLLASCAPATPIEPTSDVMAIRTSAANTVVAEFTLTAAAFTPTPQLPKKTPTPDVPTQTPTVAYATDPTQVALGTPAALCDDYSFDINTLDVTVLDGTVMTPGQEFVKTWKIKNTGICSWGDGYEVIFSYSSPPNEDMDGKPIPLTTLIGPGQEVDISAQFNAPLKPGEYTGYWQMVNPKGVPFGTKDYILIVKIVVQ